MHQSTKLHITPQTELTEIIQNYPVSILFLEHFDIFLPLKVKTIDKICVEKNISSDLFIAFANLYIGNDYTPNPNLKISDLLVILEYLKNSHKYYLDEIYPNIQQCILLIKELNDFDEIKMVDKFFQDYFAEVKEHLDYENYVVFPYITDLYESLEDNQAQLKSADYSVAEYKEHHNDIEEKLDDLINLLIKYLPLKNDQQVRRKLFLHLAELDYDLKVHAKIEDLVLIPLVEKMEQQLNRKK